MSYYGNTYPQMYNQYPQNNPFMYSNQQQSFQQNPQTFQPQPQTNTSSITWVQGEIGAKAYPIAPGTSVLLMDSDEQCFYIKSADTSGMPSLRKYEYNEIIEEPLRLEKQSSYDPEYDTAKLASREEVKELQNEIHKLKEHIKTLEEKNNESQRRDNNKGGKQNG